MSVSEDERTEFPGRNETRENHDFCVWIATVEGRVLRLNIFLSRIRFRGVFWLALSVAESLMRYRRVRIWMTFGNPCDWRMSRNSKVSCNIFKRDLKEMNDI